MQAQLEQFTTGRGFIAALDQSGGSTPKALENYGIGADRYVDEQQMIDLVHAMRTRIITSPEFDNSRILGAILFEGTMESSIEGMLTADFLWERKRIIPFLKIDVGLEMETDGISLMKPIPQIDTRLQHACERNIFGTKMRSVIHDAIPDSVAAVVDQQFELASRIRDHGLVPIVEPEVAIDSPHKADCEDLLRTALVRHLDTLGEGREVALKLTLPEQDGLYDELVMHPNTIRVTALSGGYARDEACRRLARNRGMVASFSRALAEDLSESMSDAEFDVTLRRSVAAIHAASV